MCSQSTLPWYTHYTGMAAPIIFIKKTHVCIYNHLSKSQIKDIGLGEITTQAQNMA